MSPDQPSYLRSREYAPLDFDRDAAFGICLLVFTVGQASVRYFRILTGAADLHPDARLVWRPLARAVRDGATLYVPPATDNKPPLFEFLNVAVGLTDAYTFTFLLLVALANGVSAVLLYRLFVRHGMWRAGVLAATGFVLVVPVVAGHAINVRSFAVCAFLCALSVRSAELGGTATAVAALFSQYLVLGALVAYWWRGHVRTDERVTSRWLLRFVAAAVATCAVAYGAVLAAWGWPAFVGSLHWSIGSAGRYFTAYGPSVWVGQRAWLIYMADRVRWLWPFLLLVLVGGVAVLAGRVPGPTRTNASSATMEFQRMLVGAGTLFGSLLFVRPYETYWLYALPWFAGLAALGLRTAGAALTAESDPSE